MAFTATEGGKRENNNKSVVHVFLDQPSKHSFARELVSPPIVIYPGSLI